MPGKLDDGLHGAPDRDRHAGRRRRTSVGILVFLGCALSLLSLVAVWTRNTLLDTNHYVAAVAPLARNRDIQEAGAKRITARFTHATDLPTRLADALPGPFGHTGRAIAATVDGVVHDAALKVLSSDQFATIWEDANRRAHPQVVAALTGKKTSGVTVKNGAVVLDLSDAADRVRARVSSLGFDVSSDRKVDVTIELFRSPYVGWAQDGVDLLQHLARVLPALMVLCFGGAIVLSRDRRRTVLHCGLGIAAAMTLLLASLNLARGPYLGLFPRSEGKQAGGAAFDQILKSLRFESRTVFALGLILALGAWIAGPGARADRVRGIVTRTHRDREPRAFAHRS
jgi:hypothetical protein